MKLEKITQPEIAFTQEKVAKLRQCIESAKRQGKTTFNFEGHTLFVPYAQYLLEYVESILPEQIERIHS